MEIKVTEQKIASATESRESFKNGCRIHVCLSMLKKAILIKIVQLQLIKLLTNNWYAFPLLEMMQGVVLTQNVQGLFTHTHSISKMQTVAKYFKTAISGSELSLKLI